MRVLIFGAGAIGCFLGAALTFAGHEIILYTTTAPKAEFFRRNGLYMTELADGSCRHAQVQAVSTPTDCGHIDLCLLTVKAYDTPAAAPVLSAIKGDFPILCLQNGMGHMEALEKYLPRQRLLPGIIYVGSRIKTPGHIIRSGPGKILFGTTLPESQKAALFSEKLLREANLPAIAVFGDELERILWDKLTVNSVVNTLTAIHGVNNGVLRENRFHEIKLALVSEAVAVAAAYGVELSIEKLMARLIEVCTHSAGNRSSMLEDISNGRKTEIDHINGFICRMGDKAGISTPTQQKIALEITKLEKAAAQR